MNRQKVRSFQTTPFHYWLRPTVTEVSWGHVYLGPAAEALWEHIKNHYNPTSDRVYAPFCSVVQSTGTGKSRTADELGKTQFCIPINLRGAQSPGIVFLALPLVSPWPIMRLSRISSCWPRGQRLFDDEWDRGSIISPGLLFYWRFVLPY